MDDPLTTAPVVELNDLFAVIDDSAIMPRLPISWLDARWAFETRGLTVALLTKLEAIPGVRVEVPRNRLIVPASALSVVEALAHENRCALRTITKGKELDSTPLRQSLLHPWVLDSFLLPYQREGISFTVQRGGGLLVWAPGGGKTIGALAWALQYTPTRILVVTRAHVRDSWKREVDRYSTAEPYVLRPESTMRKKDEDKDAYVARIESTRSVQPDASPLVIVSWDSLSHYVDWLAESYRAPVVVFDEVHRGKEPRRTKYTVGRDGRPVGQRLNNTSDAAFRVAHGAQRRLGCSATPIPDRVRDLWSQLDLVASGSWGSFYDFAFRHCAAHEGAFGGLDTKGASHLPELKTRLATFTHKVAASVSHAALPEKRRQIIRIRVEDQNKGDSFLREMKQAAVKRDKDLLLELRLTEAASRKRNWIVARVREALDEGQKILLFTNRRRLRERLDEALKRYASRAGAFYGSVDGGIDGSVRDQVREDYLKAAGPALLIATGDSMGEGVNIHDTDLFLVSMLPWTPGQLWQWEHRVHRLGSKRRVLIQYLIAESTVDEHVSSMLLDKLPAVDTLVEDESLAGVTRQLDGQDDRQAILDKLFAKMMQEGEGT